MFTFGPVLSKNTQITRNRAVAMHCGPQECNRNGPLSPSGRLVGAGGPKRLQADVADFVGAVPSSTTRGTP